jgi:thiol-disulfide isomerase/thioredoxin
MATAVAKGMPPIRHTIDELLQQEHLGPRAGGRIDNLMQSSTAIQEREAELSDAAIKPAAATKTGPVEEVHSEEELDNWLNQAPGLVVLEVVASWCRVCKNFTPKYKRLAGEYDHVKFLKVVGNENDSTRSLAVQRFQIKKTPSFIFLRDGEVVATQQGGNMDKLHSILQLA